MKQANMFLCLLNTTLLCFIFIFMNTPGLMITVATGRTISPFTNETDCQSLLAIKDLIPGDPLHVFSSWNHSIHFCYWQGVTCSRRHQRVVMLNLPSQKLVGSLSPHFGNLTFLRRVDLRNNSFLGTIPREMGRLFRLQYLHLNNNSFQGEFPSNLTHCSDIRVLHLSYNNLGGKFPYKLGSFSNLLLLDLAGNNFIGTIPLSFRNLSTLRVLSIAYNNLEGSIFELGQLSKLEFVQLSYNKFSGMVPTLLYNISSIFFFSITGNLLHGSLPQDLGLTLPKLQVFLVGRNLFHGRIPSSLSNASGLKQFSIAQSAFTGPAPMNLGSLHDLELLNFATNSLGSNKGNHLMNFLTSLSNCSKLRWLDLSENHFKGVLPNSIANLSTKLNRLGLANNYITGSIPLGIGNLGNLYTLGLGENMLTGSIPDSIGKLSKLEGLYIYRTNISGEIPFSIGNITQLSILSLQENMLEGSIPVSLSNCTNLQGIDLEYNHLNGAIPVQLLGLSSLSVGLFLDHNYLTGFLPMQVGKLKNLGYLDVSENKLSGDVPTTLGSCQVLEFLFMEGNLFRGTIPTSFKQLKGIQVLDLFRNNLSGQIPWFLGELSSIQYINLSYNMFEGEVPNQGVFKNISAFSVVGNIKLCGGLEALQLPTCPSKVSKRRKSPFLQRVIITLVTISVIVPLLLCLLTIIYRIRRSKRQASFNSSLQNQHPKLSYAELLQATNGFSSANLIGEGRYGSVYKGILHSGEQVIAVKVLKLQECGANKSFMVECEAMRNIRHRNLVKIITSCSSIDFQGNDFKALVFEFMPNGSLGDWLHPISYGQQDQKNLILVQRINIAIDVASALDYLHHHCETAIIHCDLKPNNVLLDDNFCAHVSDFGLAKFLSASTDDSNHAQFTSIGIRGTVGYVAPEYGMGEEVSTKGEVYSYGILLLELFTGKRPTNSMFTDSLSLHNCVKMALPDGVMEIVDPKLILEDEDGSHKTNQSSRSNIPKIKACLVSILRIGVLCSIESPSERMNVRDVLKELFIIRNAFLGVERGTDINS